MRTVLHQHDFGPCADPTIVIVQHAQKIVQALGIEIQHLHIDRDALAEFEFAQEPGSRFKDEGRTVAAVANVFNDAEAIAEAVQRPTMKFVPIKTANQLDLQAMHRIRERAVSQRTRVVNQMRASFAKTGAENRPLG